MNYAIMQPYFFPYIGYYSLVANTDYFIFFDTPQYIKKGWINRNRILSCKNEPIYVNVPVQKAERATAIKDICINNNENWKEKIYGQLTAYKAKAPYYNRVLELVENVVNTKTQSISVMAQESIKQTVEYLGYEKKYDIFSYMDMDITVSAPDEWALEITKALGGEQYTNPIGGKEFFDARKYDEAGIELFFINQELIEYNQFGGDFEPGLSMLDVMMFCSPSEIREMMKHYKFEKGVYMDD